MNFINSFSKSGVPVKDLSRFERLMNHLGNPQNRLEFIHVAGTNGKGSVVRMISEAFMSAGFVTGEYVSPFIYRYNDRIMINGKEISDDELSIIGTEIIPVIKSIGETGYSQFEITTAIAFLYFAAKKCDVVVLETGLGGLLDCTNIIQSPACSVITSVSLDHTNILGRTLSQIATHKAGIIKYGSPVVMQCGNHEDVTEVVTMRSTVLGSQLIVPDVTKLAIHECGADGNKFTYKGKKYQTTMIGKHQIYNALTAIEALEAVRKDRFRIRNGDVYNGIYYAQVPSRCQVIQKKAPMVILDGGHNPDGMRALAETIKDIRYTPKVMVCGMLDSKDWKTSVGYISPYIDKAFCVDGFYKNAVFAPGLAECFRDAEVAGLREAYYKACVYAGKNGLVIIGGSLYLASAINKYGYY